MDRLPAALAEAPPEFHSVQGGDLERFLQRQKASPGLPSEVDLELQLRTILEKARELVPSESGAILLDDPLQKVDDRAKNVLCFVTAFGPGAATLPGTRVPAARGVAGKVYRTGHPYRADAVSADAVFAREAAEGDERHSVLAAPIAIGGAVCGVIELIDRPGGAAFTERDLALLEIFAGYTSSTLQNALDAKRANELARRDDLTGLANDRWLHHRLVEMIAEADQAGRPCCLVFFDLDRFKGVNDTYGHLAGSQVLREVGFLLRRTVDREGVILARYGGDEFVAGLPNTGLDEAVEIAERIRAAIEGGTYIERDHGPELRALHLTGAISASLGVAEYVPGHSSAPAHVKEQSLLHRADTAMYAAKAAGKNRVCVDAG
ncbi:MAG TPA: sensor domain-containing diguanylate cyclase [Longimicrobium sp.]